MFSDVSKLFSREFVVGYFLPSVLFLITSAYMQELFQPSSSTNLTNLAIQFKDFWAFPAALFLGWILALILLAANSTLMRILEGYYFRGEVFLRFERWQFRKLKSKIDAIEKTYLQEMEKQDGVSTPTIAQYKLLLAKYRTRFPPDEKDLLPTSFGNTIRAFEYYPLEMYGIDAIAIWPRIIALVSAEYRQDLSVAKSQLDLALNLFYLSLVIIIQYAGYWVILRQLPLPLLLIVTILIVWISYHYAMSAACHWGELVKGVFDLYRIPLAKQLGVKLGESWADEKKSWYSFSQSLLYWDKFNLPRVQTEHQNSSAKAIEE